MILTLILSLIPGIYLLKSVILVFAALIAVQGISLAIRSLLTLMSDEPETSNDRVNR